MAHDASTWTTKGAATRARIVDAAAELIAERGIDGVGINDVRQATSTSHGQIFHYFPGGRTELLQTVIVRQSEQALDDQRPELDRLDSWDSWTRWRDGLIAVHTRRPTIHGCPLGSLVPQLGHIDDETRALLGAGLETWREHLRRGVEALRGNGLIASDVDAGKVAASILRTVQGGLLLMQATGSVRELEDALDDALDLLQSLSARPTVD